MVNQLTDVAHPDKVITLSDIRKMIDGIQNGLQQLVAAQGQVQAEENSEQHLAQEQQVVEGIDELVINLPDFESDRSYFCQLIDYTKQKGAGGAILEQNISWNDEKLVITPSQRREVATTWKCKCTIDNPVDKKVCLLGCC